jgi:lactate dehydrogenase-like 2-hydroxyacid dehydrogenase
MNIDLATARTQFIKAAEHTDIYSKNHVADLALAAMAVVAGWYLRLRRVGQ